MTSSLSSEATTCSIASAVGCSVSGLPLRRIGESAELEYILGVLYVPSVYRPGPVLRSIEQGWEGSGIEHIHQSNSLTEELYRTIGQSVPQMDHVLHRKEPSVVRPRQ
ncbi:hypothetical protein DEO72_LG5g663 [Vigna unguiculata]|uniref:Uncharacterized protein n=1 Tax=Vigna unguiculata TaxID=3917 RepID=A0A4D6LX75_VIGUN|nr:hypothetical protein DEO72_LG5g663 [Vigna unguiculata]